MHARGAWDDVSRSLNRFGGSQCGSDVPYSTCLMRVVNMGQRSQFGAPLPAMQSPPFLPQKPLEKDLVLHSRFFHPTPGERARACERASTHFIHTTLTVLY
jgi:hypothetical protein